MPNVVVDTSVSLPATLSPGGARRKLWVLLALGALTYEVEHGRRELEALRAQAARKGGAVGGIESSLARLERGSDRRAALSERLPLRDAGRLGGDRLGPALRRVRAEVEGGRHEARPAPSRGGHPASAAPDGGGLRDRRTALRGLGRARADGGSKGRSDPLHRTCSRRRSP